MRTNVTNTQGHSFYTQNGWCGKSYDSKLTGKDIAAKVREYVKKNFPEYKFSVRSKFGMSADTIYITLLSGPVPALMEGNPNKYESSISGFGEQYKDRITPEVLKMMDDIYSYVNSFRFSDSDGMIDYFDTNFYCWMYVGDYGKPYQITEPKAKKGSKPESNKTTKPEEPEEPETSKTGFELVDYSEKAIAVFGETKGIKEDLKKLGGKFNHSLKYKGGKRSGWIFSKRQEQKLRDFISVNKIK